MSSPDLQTASGLPKATTHLLRLLFLVCYPRSARKTNITSLEELRQTSQEFADGMDADVIKRAVRNLQQRAEVCIICEGAAAEYD